VGTGGPAGAGDSFLQLTSLGGFGPGSRMVAFLGPQWAGNYSAAQVTALRFDANNFGADDLVLRLSLSGSAGSAISTDGVLLPAGSGWTRLTLSLAPGNLSGANVLGNVLGLRLFHATTAEFPGETVAARLGIDNVTAVPEPGAALLLCGGLVMLMGTLRRRQRGGAPLVLAAGLALGGTAQAQTSVLPDIPFGNIAVRLNPVATGLSAPAYGTFAPGVADKLFVVEQNGLLRVLQNGSLLPGSAMDLSARVAPPLNPANANDERGFLGLAFHPGFSTASSAGYRTLYTYTSELIPAGTLPTWSAPNGATQGYRNLVTEWKMDTTTWQVDTASRRELMSFGKNANNHNGGTIAFGPDGYLYLGLGDGGNANDVGPSHIEPGGNAQNLSTPLGKMLRIDPINPTLTASSANTVSANGQYRIPTSNPFQGSGQVAETFALGFRNPYRFAFDRTDLGGTGDLIAADVGQRNIEEIDRVVLGGNYGWAIKEGEFVFYRTDPDGPGPLTAGSIGPRQPGTSGLIDPIQGTLGTLQYDHGDGISITGGFVYRGQAIPELFGKYVFGDLALRNAPPRVDGRLFYADLETGLIREFLLPDMANGKLPNGLTVHGFGEDAAGELYAMVTNTPANGTGGIIYQITAVPEPSQWALFGLGLAALAGLARRRRAG
jgi:glucose/arabinose dehydrogenase